VLPAAHNAGRDAAKGVVICWAIKMPQRKPGKGRVWENAASKVERVVHQTVLEE
jgi:hypothetical protein